MQGLNPFFETNQDILAEQTEEKIAITNFFGNLIKNHNTEKKDFYKVYWQMVEAKRLKNTKEL